MLSSGLIQIFLLLREILTSIIVHHSNILGILKMRRAQYNSSNSIIGLLYQIKVHIQNDNTKI